MAFGVHFDFEGASNTRVTKPSEMVNHPWFIDAVDYEEPVDIFVVLAHSPVQRTEPFDAVDRVYWEIRRRRLETPIQIFGGYTHVRDFVLYDAKATGLQSGTP
jgi:2',3'-cyclic-nucleotide 2'-phosphodiesterase (5'-nucleotidase family)